MMLRCAVCNKSVRLLGEDEARRVRAHPERFVYECMVCQRARQTTRIPERSGTESV